MIVRISKYQLILHSMECEGFIARLRELGMMDITTQGWEPADEDRSLILDVEALQKGERLLSRFAQSEAFDPEAKPYDNSKEACVAYEEVTKRIAQAESHIAELRKIAEEAAPWGEFDGEALARLESDGLQLSYFVAMESLYERIVEQRGEELILVPINRVDGKLYFVVVSRGDEAKELDLDAQLLKPLTLSLAQAEAQIAEAEVQRRALDGDLSRVACSVELLAQQRMELTKELQLSRVSGSAEAAADGSLLVMEGWAEESSSAQVDELLEKQQGLFYIKSQPTPEDNTPVKLHNNRYSRLFEMVSNLYALPKYGTIDLTPFFAPFYMLFFAICLCDAGYGAIIFGAGLTLFFKGGEAMRQPAWLSMVCGGAAIIFGFFANSVFGMEISSVPIFENFKFIDFQTDFFSVSMILGIVQILFGMLINIVVTTRSFGFRYALGSVGWFTIIFSSALSGALSAMGIAGFELGSTPHMIVVGVGLAMLLLLNSPGKNIFANLGAGVWQAYDRTTGLLGDVLSYIRLFAIGLSGGVLALVFNDLAMGMTGLSGDLSGEGVVSIILKIVAASAILLVGHGINLFMSAISSFVHPMRLTFVEFYKNAGFEMSTRKFDPIK